MSAEFHRLCHTRQEDNPLARLKLLEEAIRATSDTRQASTPPKQRAKAPRSQLSLCTSAVRRPEKGLEIDWGDVIRSVPDLSLKLTPHTWQSSPSLAMLRLKRTAHKLAKEELSKHLQTST